MGGVEHTYVYCFSYHLLNTILNDEALFVIFCSSIIKQVFQVDPVFEGREDFWY